MKNNKGFTLIELMIVAAIIGILVAIALPVITGDRHVNPIESSRDSGGGRY